MEKLDGTTEVRMILSKPLDREVNDLHLFKVIAYDGGQPPRSGSLEVSVFVLKIVINTVIVVVVVVVTSFLIYFICLFFFCSSFSIRFKNTQKSNSKLIFILIGL